MRLLSLIDTFTSAYLHYTSAPEMHDGALQASMTWWKKLTPAQRIWWKSEGSRQMWNIDMTGLLLVMNYREFIWISYEKLKKEGCITE
jgi:hypothetical protein